MSRFGLSGPEGGAVCPSACTKECRAVFLVNNGYELPATRDQIISLVAFY